MNRSSPATLCLLVCGLACGRQPTVATTAPEALGPACDGAKLLQAPVDLATRGPWAVGARTVEMEELTVEVWYPAAPGASGPATRYDLRRAMPEVEAAKIPDADNAWLTCECSRDLPVDERHGVYPVVMFLHGAASFRAQSVFLATHWASRGFVVIAPDLPGVGLRAALGGEQEFPLGVPRRLLDAIKKPPQKDPFAFIRNRLGARIAVVGHSLGSMLASTLSDRDDIGLFISLAGASAMGNAPTLVVGGDHDQIAPVARMKAAIGESKTTRLAVIHGAGHLAFTDLCTLAADRGGALEVARQHGVAIPDLLATLATDGCRPTDRPFHETAPEIRAVTAGALEQHLRCATSAGDRMDVR